ncbi:flagellar hook-associated protein 2 [Aquibacillus kalidii]|uniref:flagellar hook-associated protein 2 n=1 Tax=Aquibacillus kalidii TaxID=2762597 RepID=UPI001646B4DC|nr:flagellar hook-associated protein 2 [Aquibacillus kalidii]
MVSGISSTRLSGLASGMDTEALVAKLMDVEKMPLTKMQQDKSWMTWQRDAYRDTNKALYDFNLKLSDMKYTKSYMSKTTTSSQPNAVTVTGNTASSNGSYSIQVNELATAAIKVGTQSLGSSFDPDAALSSDLHGDITFSTYNESGEMVTKSVTIAAGDTLNGVLKKISDSDAGLRAFYDKSSGKVVMERTATGDFNPVDPTTGDNDGEEIILGASSFFDFVNLSGSVEQNGTNAEIVYNGGLTLTPKSNSYTMNGLTFNFNTTTTSPAQITVDNNVDEAFNKIKEFIDEYNKLVEKLNGSLTETRYRDYKPLTDEQKEGMSEDQVKLWEERAKSGLLKGDSLVTDGLFDIREKWYTEVNTGGAYDLITDLGIGTSKEFLESGILTIKDEQKLKDALRNDPESVYKLFANNEAGSDKGLVYKLEASIKKTMTSIEERAGKSTSTNQQYTLGKRLDDLDDRIDDFQQRLATIENRYWSQFTAMEKAMTRFNSQSMYLSNQFGGF